MYINTIAASLALAYATAAFHIPPNAPALHPTNSSVPSAEHHVLPSNHTHAPWNMTEAPKNHTREIHARAWEDHATCPSGSTPLGAKINLVDTVACCKVHTYNKLEATLTADGALNCHIDAVSGYALGGNNPERDGLPEAGQKCIGGYKICKNNPRGCCDPKIRCKNGKGNGETIAPCASHSN